METTAAVPKPLSDAEFARLSQGLRDFGGKHAMNLETLDGFLAALVSGPDHVPQKEYLEEIWGDSVVNEDAFIAQPTLQDLVFLVLRHRDSIAHTLQSGDAFTPLLLEDEKGICRGNDWAIGFLRGMEMRRRGWSSLLDDEENGGSLVPILALAHEHDPDPELRSYTKPVDAEMREKLIVGAAAGVMRIYRYFQAQRLTHSISENITYRRIAPKVGRNDPCPCGSGKKFKQCCGAITLH
jgi:uncharacterized protein